MDGRDVRGRFVPGNQIAKGNKGNHNSKWGNKNARKHGFYAGIDLLEVCTDGWLHIRFINNKPVCIRIHPEAFIRDDKGIQYN